MVVGSLFRMAGRAAVQPRAPQHMLFEMESRPPPRRLPRGVARPPSSHSAAVVTSAATARLLCQKGNRRGSVHGTTVLRGLSRAGPCWGDGRAIGSSPSRHDAGASRRRASRRSRAPWGCEFCAESRPLGRGRSQALTVPPGGATGGALVDDADRLVTPRRVQKPGGEEQVVGEQTMCPQPLAGFGFGTGGQHARQALAAEGLVDPRGLQLAVPAPRPEFDSSWAHEGRFRGGSPVFTGFSGR